MASGGTEQYELTDNENLCLEAAQEQGTVYADDVCTYVYQSYGHEWPKAKATRLLCRLTKLGILERLPRVSAGWGQGWHPSAYKVR